MIDSKTNISVNTRLSQKQAAVKSEWKINAVTGVKDWGLYSMFHGHVIDLLVNQNINIIGFRNLECLEHIQCSVISPKTSILYRKHDFQMEL